MRAPSRIWSRFLTVFWLIYVGAHLYVWWQLVFPLPLTGWPAWAVPSALLFLFGSFPVIHYLVPHGKGRVLAVAAFVSAVWMGIIVYLALGTLVYDFLRLISWGALPSGGMMTGTVACFTAVLTIHGFIRARAIGVTRLRVPIQNLPRLGEGFRIVQISDVHLGLVVQKSRLERIVTMVNALDPDLIVSTGDLVDANPTHLKNLVPLLQKFRSRYGVLAVTGNHEFLVGADRAQAFTERAGLTMLRNRWVSLADFLQVIGWDDEIAARVTGLPRPSLDDIMRGIDRTKSSILLCHTPVTTLAELEAHGIQLQLSGHTHQGQLWPVHYLIQWMFQTPYGLFTNGLATIYVSRGTGTWGPPMRVAARPEITLVTLTAKA